MAIINAGHAEISWLNQRIRDLEKQNMAIAREQARKIEELKSSLERLMAEKAPVYKTSGNNIGNSDFMERFVNGSSDFMERFVNGSSDFMERFVNGLKKHKGLIRDLSTVTIGLLAVFLLGFECGRPRTSLKLTLIDPAQLGGPRR